MLRLNSISIFSSYDRVNEAVGNGRGRSLGSDWPPALERLD